MKYVFGPVPSGRLGNSLGIDIVPHKTCTLDCRFCECGKTIYPAAQRRSFFPINDIIAEIKSVTQSFTPGSIDFLTFSGSGEPTLNSDLEDIIDIISRFRPEKIAVITNSTLLYQKPVRQAIQKAHYVLPTISTVFPHTYAAIHKPVSQDITLERVLEGLQLFCREYSNTICLELFFCPGLNDTPEEIEGLIKFLKTLTFHSLYFNTMTRPGTERKFKGLSISELKSIKTEFPGEWKIEIAGDSFRRHKTCLYDWEGCKEMLFRRPVALTDLAAMSSENETSVYRNLQKMAQKNRLILKKSRKNGKEYLYLCRS